MAAEATTCEDLVNEGMSLLEEIATILDGVTPATADESIAKLDALKPKMDALMEMGSKFSPEEQKAVAEKPEVQARMKSAMERMIGSTMKLAFASQTATPEEKAQIEKVLLKLQSLQPSGNMPEDDEDMDDDTEE